MKELVTIEQAQKLMIILLVALPLAGAVIGAFNRKFLLGLAIGALVGVANFILWSGYNAITNHFGLDSVKGLLINLVLFCIVGAVLGIAWGSVTKAKRRKHFPASASKGAFAEASISSGPTLKRGKSR
jgi:hypothetical protein